MTESQDITLTDERAEAQKKTERMGTERIGKLLFEFSLPCVVMVIFNSLYNIIDAAFLGIAFPDGSGVAVTTLALPVQNILFGFSMLAGVGGSTLASIQLGEGSKNAVEKTLGNTVFLLVVIAAAVAFTALVFMDPLLAFIGTPDELWDKTTTFVRIICLFFVFQSLGGGMNNFLRSAGQPTLALVTSVLGTVMCIIFNYLFVLQFGWGIAGSASATVLGQACGMVPVLGFFLFYRKAAFRLRLRALLPNIGLIGRILALGAASFAMQAAMSAVNVVFNHVVGIHAPSSPLSVSEALGSIGVAQRILFFGFTPIIGISMGAQPLIGFNCGAQQWRRVLKLLKWSCLDGVFFATAFFLVCELMPGPIVELFGVTGELREFSILSLRIYTLWMPFIGYQAVASSYFQSSGQPLKATILELTRQVIFLIPLYLFLPQLLESLFGIMGLMGVIICVPVSDMLATITTTVFVIIEVRKLYARIDAQEREQEETQGSAA